jgi:hypothetical protein
MDRADVRSELLQVPLRVGHLWAGGRCLGYCSSIHLERLYENNHDAVINQAIKRADITSRLNLRIRLPYACAQLISRTLTGVRLLVSINSNLIGENSQPVESASPILFSTQSLGNRGLVA